tara:strand:+ start:8863 stop:9174 length:312 start_codon:yes stop_codon:yes gene_type:complete
MSDAIAKAVKSQFAFAKRNGSGSLSINGSTVDALITEPVTTEGSLRRGRQRGTRRAIVGVLKADVPTVPVPGTRASLDGWSCVVADEGVEEEAFSYRIYLISP